MSDERMPRDFDPIETDNRPGPVFAIAVGLVLFAVALYLLIRLELSR